MAHAIHIHGLWNWDEHFLNSLKDFTIEVLHPGQRNECALSFQTCRLYLQVHDQVLLKDWISSA